MSKMREAIQRLAQPAKAHELLLLHGAALPLPILLLQGQAVHFTQIPHFPRAHVSSVGQSKALIGTQVYDTIVITAKPY